MAVTKYADFSKVASGNGSDWDNAFNPDDFAAFGAAGLADDTTINCRGEGTYTCSNVNAVLKLEQHAPHTFTVQSGEDTPAKLTCILNISDGNVHDVIGIEGSEGNGQPMTITRMCIEIKSNVTSGSIRNFRFTNMGSTCGNPAITVQNCLLISNVVFSGTSYLYFPDNTNVIFKGNTFVNLSASSFTALFGANNNTAYTVTLNSNYFEGKFDYLFWDAAGGNAWLIGTYKYNAVYNNSSYLGLYFPGSFESMADGGNNLLNAGSATQITALNDLSSMTLPADLRPKAALQGAGDPSLGLSVDIMNVARNSPPALGAEEPSNAATTTNTFSATPVRNGTPVTSTINTDYLINKIQTDSSDLYFDSSSEFGRVFLYFTHTDGRQEKIISHEGASLSGNVFWTSNAKSGVWQLTKAVAIDTDGAKHVLRRPSFGGESDTTLA
jgi:hypothetical protein